MQTMTLDPETITAYESRIRPAYQRLASEPGTWVSLTDLRPEVGGYRGAVDAALTAMVETGEIIAIPQSAQWLLTDWDRHEALHCGGQAKHLVRLV